jgi:hypothetical protein
MANITVGNLQAIAWHLEKGQDNGAITREALAVFLRDVAAQLEAAADLEARSAERDALKAAYHRLWQKHGDLAEQTVDEVVAAAPARE